MDRTDFTAIIGDVARRLAADRHVVDRGAELRIGSRGSLVVHVAGARAGTWRDYEADRSGGTLALIQHLLQCDRAGALRWLEAERLIPDRRSAGSAPPPPAPPAPKPKPKPPSSTAAVARGILEASMTADLAPARDYLAKRWCWPPYGVGPDVPPSVRWLPQERIPEVPRWHLQRDGAERRLRLPPDDPDAAGFVVFVLDAAPGGEVAVKLEAITAAGYRTAPRWRRAFGSRTAFTAADRPGGECWIAEGELDALALAVTGAGGLVRAAGGTSGMRAAVADDPENRPVVVVPDADRAGAGAAVKLLDGIPADRPATVACWPLSSAMPDWWSDWRAAGKEWQEAADRHAWQDVLRVMRGASGDPASWLAEWVVERAGIRQHDGGMDPREAADHAWRDVLRAVERGERLIDPEAERLRDRVIVDDDAEQRPERPHRSTR